MTGGTLLRLGRTSNLPTVWTNVLAAAVLAGGPTPPGKVAALAAAMSLFYTGGMFLNDAFDRETDARERPGRPIPAGEATARAVFLIGFGLLAAALLVLAAIVGAGAGDGEWTAVAAGAALGAAIVLYDARHKGNPLAPVLMALCRVLVYATVGLALAGALPASLRVGTLALFAYVVGLSYVARQETLAAVVDRWPLLILAVPAAIGLPALARGPLPALLYAGFLCWLGLALRRLARRRAGDVPVAVASLIAGISLLDAVLIALAGAPGTALVAVGGFALTLALHRRVPGT